MQHHILSLEPSATALVLIDLQKGIVSNPALAPRSGSDVVKVAVQLIDAARAKNITTVLVHVGFSADQKDRLQPPTDQPAMSGKPSADFSEIVPELSPASADITIFKHQWGAFYGTELDLQLRRRGIKTIILAGISTNIGVESTARDAWERGYEIIFVEDAMASSSIEMHQFAIKDIFPRIGRVRNSEQVLEAMKGST